MQRYEKYKDSGIDWLGEVPQHWEVKKLKYILKEINVRSSLGTEELLSLSKHKGVLPKSNLEERTGGALSLVGYKLVYKNSLVFNKMQAVNGLIAVSKVFGITSPDYSIYESITHNIHYIGKLLSLPLYLEQYKKVVTGVMDGFIRLYTDDLFGIFSLLPPLHEQKAIVEFLDDKCEKIDAAIVLKEQQIEKLKELRQITIHNAVTKGVSHFKGKVVPTKDSGIDWIGEIPQDWEVKRLKHVSLKIGSGVTPSGGATTYLDEGIPLLRSQNILFNEIDLSTVAFISQRVHDSMSNSKVKKYDVLLNITGGSIGRCNIVDFDLEMNVNQHVCIIRPVYINPFFLNKLIASEIGQLQIWYYQQGGGREGLNFQNLKNFLFPVPPLSEQEEIVAYLEEQTSKIDKAIVQKQEQIVKLKEYKQSLINEVVTGKIKVTA